MYMHVHVASKNFFLRIVLVFMKKLWGIYNIIQIYILFYTVYHIASCTNGLQYMHYLLHRNRKDMLVRKTETVYAFVKVHF